MTPPDWETTVSKVEGHCAACNADLVLGSTAVAALYLKEGSFSRRDWCERCFAANGGEPFSFWRRDLTVSKERRKPILDIAFLTDFFHRLRSEPLSPETAPILFIVSILLVRKKILDLLGTETTCEGTGIRVRLKRGGESWFIPDPGITEEKMASIKDDLARIFDIDGGGNGNGNGSPAV
jgi:hypothetical protein